MRYTPWEYHDPALLDPARAPAAHRGHGLRIRFRIDRPGTCTILCTLRGHAEAGMTGTLVVEAAD